MKKKILFVNSTLTAGGSEKVMTILANEFLKLDYDVDMVLIRESKKENYFVDKKINLIRFNYKNSNKVLKIVERIIKLRKLIKNNKYDTIISFMHEINSQVLVSSLGLKTNVIVSERCDPASRNVSKLVSSFENNIYRLAKYVVLQTEQIKKQYPKYLQKRFVVIPNPISNNIPIYNGPRANKIVSAGRLSPQKNFNLLIDAFKDISSKYDFKLYIYGDGILKRDLESKIKEYNLQDRIFLPGYVSNVDEIIKDAKIYVCSSNYEGISNSMLEAMAMGIPTISTDCPVGGSRMMINDHENGILIPVNNKEKLINAMVEILEDEKLFCTLSENGKKINDRLNSRKITLEWEKLL